jgi:hypothetical protein
MAEERQDLVLTVRLDDQASAQLQRTRASIAELGGEGLQGLGLPAPATRGYDCRHARRCAAAPA